MSRAQRRCPTGKRKFSSHFAALVELWVCQAKAHWNIRRVEDRVYACSQCGGYHLTSQEARDG